MPGIALFQEISPALLRTELAAAGTVFAILVPSAMAYGDLAGVNPVQGLYVALAAMVMYALFGTSRQLIMGPEATTAIVTATAIAPLAGGDPAHYAALAAMAAILAGLFAFLARISKLGFITDFLSKPILVGYIFGTALIVIGSQLGKMFGISIQSDDFFRQVLELLNRLDEANWLTLFIGVVCMTTLVWIRRVNRTFPGPLLLVAVSILVSTGFGLAARGVAVVGTVPAGLPHLEVPNVTWRDVYSLLPAALALTVLIYADEVLTGRVFAAKHGQKINSNQELVAIGMVNIGAGLLMGFPAATSSSRTAVADQMGGKTQWVGLLAAALTIVFLLFFTPLLAPLPSVVLGAIIIIASVALLDVAEFRYLLRVRTSEFWLAVATCLGVLTLGVIQGILIALMLSMITVIYHISRPHDALLVEADESGGTFFRDIGKKDTGLVEAGLIVYRFDSPLVFANAVYFVTRLEDLVANAGESLKCVIFDAEAVSDFDSTAAEALQNLVADLERINVEFWIARPNGQLLELLALTGLMNRLGKESVFPSVHAAVEAYRRAFATPD